MISSFCPRLYYFIYNYVYFFPSRIGNAHRHDKWKHWKTDESFSLEKLTVVIKMLTGMACLILFEIPCICEIQILFTQLLVSEVI